MNFHDGCVAAAVSSAKIQNHTGPFQAKPDVYVELIVDRLVSEAKRTDVLHKTLHPSWDKNFTV